MLCVCTWVPIWGKGGGKGEVVGGGIVMGSGLNDIHSFLVG